MGNLLDRVDRVGNLYIHPEIYNFSLNKARPEEAEMIWENKNVRILPGTSEGPEGCVCVCVCWQTYTYIEARNEAWLLYLWSQPTFL